MKPNLLSHSQARRSLFSCLVVCTGLACLTLPANAATVNCQNAQTQSEMNFCAGQSYAAADGDLNVDYKKAIAAMKEMDGDLLTAQKGAVKALRAAQRQWIIYRDKACTAEAYTVKGGSMEPLIFTTCRERLTRQRSEELRRLFEMN